MVRVDLGSHRAVLIGVFKGWFNCPYIAKVQNPVGVGQKYDAEYELVTEMPDKQLVLKISP